MKAEINIASKNIYNLFLQNFLTPPNKDSSALSEEDLLKLSEIFKYNHGMEIHKTHIEVDLQDSWECPSIEEIGNASDLIKEAKFSGFSDGVSFNGSPIGQSSRILAIFHLDLVSIQVI